VIDHPSLENFVDELYTQALTDLIVKEKPNKLLLAGVDHWAFVWVPGGHCGQHGHHRGRHGIVHRSGDAHASRHAPLLRRQPDGDDPL
jgi:hypothetical protein